MTYDEKAALTRRGDTSPAAISRRLTAARMIVEPVQKAFARLVNLSTTTYNSQEIRGAPSIDVLSYIYLNHRVDFNFVLFGDFVTLPGDVQERLFAALHEID